MVDALVDWLAGWLVDCLVDALVGWLVEEDEINVPLTLSVFRDNNWLVGPV